jgi:stage III sporulation protein AD
MIDRSFVTASFCLCSAILAVILRQYCREQSMLLAIAACTIIMGSFAAFASPVMRELRDIFTAAGVSDSYLSLIYKGAAICIVTRITSELCRDSGEGAIASVAELWGRGAVTLLSLPLVKAVLEQINQLM